MSATSICHFLVALSSKLPKTPKFALQQQNIKNEYYNQNNNTKQPQNMRM